MSDNAKSYLVNCRMDADTRDKLREIQASLGSSWTAATISDAIRLSIIGLWAARCMPIKVQMPTKGER